MKRQKNYDKKVKVTRILLADYLALKGISLAAGISMPEALHRLIEHQAQLPLMDRIERPVSVGIERPMSVTLARSIPVTRARSTPVTTSFSREVATNGH